MVVTKAIGGIGIIAPMPCSANDGRQTSVVKLSNTEMIEKFRRNHDISAEPSGTEFDAQAAVHIS